MLNKEFIEGSTLLGVALTLFGVGFIVPDFSVKCVMFICFSLYMIFASIAFIPRKKH